MVKKTLISVMVISIVAMLIGLGTFAYFSDTEVSRGNTAQAGTIDIAVGYEWTGTAMVSDLKPSEVRYATETVENTGMNPVTVWKRTTVTDTAGGIHPESEMEEDPNDENNAIDEATIYDLMVNNVVIISEADGKTVASISGSWILLGTLQPGASMRVTQSYHMQALTTNWAQGDIMTLDIEILGQQLNAPPPAP